VAVLRVPGHTPELIEALITLALKEDAQARERTRTRWRSHTHACVRRLGKT
jgi:hypothetical protein